MRLGRFQVAGALLILDTACLWYFIVGGRLGGSLLLLAGLASICLVQLRYFIEVLARHKLIVISAGILSALALGLSPSFSESAFATLAILVVFALGYAGLSRYLVSALGRREWVFFAVGALAVALAVWAAIFASAIMPENNLVMDGTSDGNGEIERMFGVFNVGNNYYTLTYYLLVPIASASLAFAEGVSRKSLILFLAGLLSVVLAVTFGRRGPVLVGGVCWLLVGSCARRQRGSFLRTASLVGGLAVSIACGFAWLQSREWGAAVIEDFQNRSRMLFADVRFDLWRAAGQCIAEHPFGGGREAFESGSYTHNIIIDTGILGKPVSEVSTRYAHNVLLDTGLDLGVPGLLVFALLLGQITWRAIARLQRMDQQMDRLEICLIAIIVADLLIIVQEPCVPERLVILLWAGVMLSSAGKPRAKVFRKHFQITRIPAKIASIHRLE